VFTFTGRRKPAEPAEADLAKAGAHAAGTTSTGQ
jgi:ATP-dependent Clp protease ATP-binding subunit ClpC